MMSDVDSSTIRVFRFDRASQVLRMSISDGEGRLNEDSIRLRGVRQTCVCQLLCRQLSAFERVYKEESGIDCTVRNIVLRDCAIDAAAAERLMNGILLCRNIMRLDLSNNTLGPDGAAFMASALAGNVNILDLDLSLNRICGEWVHRGRLDGQYCSESVCALLLAASRCTLRSLNLSRNMIGSDDEVVDCILSVLRNPGSLQNLNLSGNSFDSIDCQRIDECMRMGGGVSNLDLCGKRYIYGKSGYGICLNMSNRGLKGVDSVFLGLLLNPPSTSSTPISALNLSRNPEFGETGLSLLVPNLLINPLQCLTLSNCGLSSDSMKALKNLLISSPHLQRLDISSNASLEPEGMRYMVDGLRWNSSVMWLNISDSIPIGYSSAHLAITLESNKTLKYLDISGAPYTFGIKSIFNALLGNGMISDIRASRCSVLASDIENLAGVLMSSDSALSSLDLSRNDVCNSTAPLLALAVTLRHTTATSKFREIDLSGNALPSEVIDGFTEALKNRELRLKTLRFNKCSLCDIDARKIGQSLPEISCLRHLFLSGNSFCMNGIMEIIFGLQSNSGLYELDLSGNVETSVTRYETTYATQCKVVEFSEALSHTLANNSTVGIINLDRNNIFGRNDRSHLLVMKNLAQGIRRNALGAANLEQLIIMENYYHECGDPDSFCGFDAGFPCEAEECLNELISAVMAHPKCPTLCGIRPTQKSFEISAFGSGLISLVAKEIQRHHMLKSVVSIDRKLCLKDVSVLSEAVSRSGSLKRCFAVMHGSPLDDAIAEKIIHEGRCTAFYQRCGFALFVRGCAHLGDAPIRIISEYIWGVGPLALSYMKYIPRVTS